MAKYQITHSCGHQVTHQIVGTNVRGERDRKIEWLAGQPCLDCTRAAERAAAGAQTADLPALTGSDKQIAWATTIRAKAVAAVRQVFEGKTLTPDQRRVADAFYAQASAGWWIDRRHHEESARQWLTEAAALIGLR